MATKLTFSETTTVEVMCETEFHAMQVAENLKRWAERESHRIEPMNRSITYNYKIEEIDITPAEGVLLDEMSKVDSRVNP
jgi:hypothetical protein